MCVCVCIRNISVQKNYYTEVLPGCQPYIFFYYNHCQGEFSTGVNPMCDLAIKYRSLSIFS